MRNNSLPRGLRNNNPGNIRRNSDVFQGEKTSYDREFKQFKSWHTGIGRSSRSCLTITGTISWIRSVR